jgi:hypothetical protein
MKSLQETINEGIKKGIVEFKPTYNIKSDIYNLLGSLAFQYNLKNKDFDQTEVESALEWFTINFFEEYEEDFN